MNEKISELDKEAQSYASKIVGNDEDSNYVEWFNVYKEKLSELIVKECVKIVTSLDQHEGPGDSSTAEYIKEHFGVA